MAEVTPLQQMALMLRAQSPEVWDAFMNEMHGRMMKSNIDMARCAPELLLRGQGMAIAMIELFEELRDAPKANDKRLRG